MFQLRQFHREFALRRARWAKMSRISVRRSITRQESSCVLRLRSCTRERDDQKITSSAWCSTQAAAPISSTCRDRQTGNVRLAATDHAAAVSARQWRPAIAVLPGRRR